MNAISSVSNSTAYPQIVNKVAEANSGNLANLAANQSAFSSYIGQAFAQIGVANPTNLNAPVVSSSNQTDAKGEDTQETVSTFIQNLFDVLSQKNSAQQPVEATTKREQNLAEQFFTQNNSITGNEGENSDAIAAYNSENATTVGNIVTNLQSLVKQLNDESRQTESDNTSALQTLKNGFQSILNAQGADPANPSTLGVFLQKLAQNLEGQSPLGIIINTYS